MAKKDNLEGCALALGLVLMILSVISLIVFAEFKSGGVKFDSASTIALVICIVGIIGCILFRIGTKN